MNTPLDNENLGRANQALVCTVWQGFQGYVTSDTDSVDVATTAHHFTSDAEHATALALTNGQCDVNSGDTYKHNLLSAVQSESGTAKVSASTRILATVCV